jgi:HPr kinase/phosphorylase
VTPAEATLHASCIARQGRGLLILGPSGVGKSALALQLMALGADLVADDQTRIVRRGSALIASCPPAIRGVIEARGMGLLRAPSLDKVEIVLAIDLAQTETDRFPPRRSLTLLQCRIDLALNAPGAHFPAAVLHYLLHGRHA